MKHWVLLITALLALGLVAGCSDKEDPDLQRLIANVNSLMAGWATENELQLERLISADYAFDEQNKADHIAAIVADFPDLRNFRLVKQQVEVISPNLASVQVEFTAQLLADVAALDQAVEDFAWVPSYNVLDQVWIKDFDGVWRLAAEYLQGSWVLDDTPVISSFSVQPGDQIPPGDTGAFSSVASAASNTHRVGLWPSSDAAAYFDPEFVFGFRSATYQGDITVRTDAYGEYSFAMIGQTDVPGTPRMLGRSLRAVYIIVSDRAGRAIIGGKVVPGNKRSVFRRMRIHRAAGHYDQPQPGAAP